MSRFVMGLLATFLGLAGLAGLAGSASASASDTVSLSVQPRWGRSPPAAWTMYDVAIGNDGGAFDGEVVLLPETTPGANEADSATVEALTASPALSNTRLERLQQVWPTYRMVVRVEASSTRRLAAMLVEAPFGYKAELRDARGGLRATAKGIGAGRTDWTLAVLGRTDTDVMKMLAVNYGYSSQVRSTVYRTAVDFPSDILGLTGLQAIFINDFDVSSLSHEQRRTIQDFVSLGGSLLLGGGLAAANNVASLPEELVLMRPYGTSQVSLASLGDLVSRQTGASASVATGDVVHGRVSLASDGIPLIIEGTFGSGHIVQLAYDPLEAPFTTDQTVGGLGLEQGLGRAFSRLDVRGSNHRDVSPATLWSPVFERPAFSADPWPASNRWAIALIVLYAAASGLGIWYAAQNRTSRLRRRTLAAVVVAVTGISVAAFQTHDRPSKNGEVVESSVEVTTVALGGAMLRARFITLSTPKFTALSTRHGSDSAISTVIAQPTTEGGAAPAASVALAQNVGGFRAINFASPQSIRFRWPAEIVRSIDGSREVRTPEVRPGRGATYQTLEVEHLDGELQLEAHLQVVPAPGPSGKPQSVEGRVEGTVTNRTPMRLRSVVLRLWSGAELHVADVLEPGATVHVGSNLATLERYWLGSRLSAAAAASAVPREGQVAVAALADPDDSFWPPASAVNVQAVLVQVAALKLDDQPVARRGRLVTEDLSGNDRISIFEISSVSSVWPTYIDSVAPAEVWDWSASAWRQVPGGGVPSEGPTADALRPSEIDRGLVRVRTRSGQSGITDAVSAAAPVVAVASKPGDRPAA